MPRISLLSISLAAKCRLLFGLAVLLIIAAALFVPWLRMRDLVHELNIQTARQIGRLALARSDPASGTWERKQEALDRWQGSEGGILWALARQDGTKLAQYDLPATPVFDGMATAQGRLYIALTDGTVVCLDQGGHH